ncbi:MAG: glutamate synthase subunit beta [Actinobacteria bacterium]|nr:glutamate synthase subunit beta [Actinomycetota bacterium]
MADPKGFLNTPRELPKRRPVDVRIKDWKEVYLEQEFSALQKQAGRCMDCGIPFCHQGCPLGNLIPEWNDLIWRGEKAEAIDRLHATNNFPEFTGRLCPAPCETACVVSINADAVTIKQVELRTIEEAFKENLRYGIPEFKMEKNILDRRLQQMEQEGTRFRTNVNVGADITGSQLRSKYDAIVLAIGATNWRDLNVPGRNAKGIYQAMEYLPWGNKQALDISTPEISAAGKDVVILGGGDTGADCLGTAIRQGAKSVTQLEIMPRPTEERPSNQPWPTYPMIYRVSSAHEEAGERMYSVSTESFDIDENGQVSALNLVETKFENGKFEPVKGSERKIRANMVLLAMGFTGPEQSQLLKQLEVELDQRGNIKRNSEYQTQTEGVFVCGDAGRGQSLIVWAIAEGRSAASAVDKYLTGMTQLPYPIEPTARPLMV